VRAEIGERAGGVAKQGSAVTALAAAVRFHPSRWAAGLAAIIAISAAGWWLFPSLAEESQTYAATAAVPRRIALLDGSVVDLNTNTRLQVQYSTGERRLNLTAGEAHFRVAHNAARPFIVTAHGISVRAVGTAFDVRLLGDNVDVLVTEGKVEIDRKAASALFSRNVTIIPQLAAGERILVMPSLVSVPRVENVPAAAVHALLCWQDQMTNFVDVPLREMVARINRCNLTQLVIEDPRLVERKIGGVIALDKVDIFVHMLEQDGDIVAERRGTEILLRSVR
jgi:transmembrane sensor